MTDIIQMSDKELNILKNEWCLKGDSNEERKLVQDMDEKSSRRRHCQK